TGQLTAGAVLLPPVALVTSVSGGLSLTPTRARAVAVRGAVGTGVAYVLNYRIIAEIGATRASLVTYGIPLVAVAVGLVVVREPVAGRLVVGGARTSSGTAAVGRRRPVAAVS